MRLQPTARDVAIITQRPRNGRLSAGTLRSQLVELSDSFLNYTGEVLDFV
jgi:hypothetical protein